VILLKLRKQGEDLLLPGSASFVSQTQLEVLKKVGFLVSKEVRAVLFEFHSPWKGFSILMAREVETEVSLVQAEDDEQVVRREIEVKQVDGDVPGLFVSEEDLKVEGEQSDEDGTRRPKLDQTQSSEVFLPSKLGWCAWVFFFCCGEASSGVEEDEDRADKRNVGAKKTLKNLLHVGKDHNITDHIPLSRKIHATIQRRAFRDTFPFWAKSYLRDYYGIFIVLAINAVLYAVDWYEDAPFFLGDQRITQPLEEDQNWVWGLMAGLTVLVFFIARWGDLELYHAYTLAAVASLLTANAFGITIASVSGQLGPDFLARCAPFCLENITFVRFPGGGIAQCDFPDPRAENDDFIYTCPRAGTDQRVACAPFFGAIPLYAEVHCSQGIGRVSDPNSIARGFQAAYSPSVGCLTAIFWPMSYVALGSFNLRPLGYAVGGFSLALIGAASAVKINQSGHTQAQSFGSFVLAALISSSIIPLYFHSYKKRAKPRRRPQATMHFIQTNEASDSETDSNFEEDSAFELEKSLYRPYEEIEEEREDQKRIRLEQKLERTSDADNQGSGDEHGKRAMMQKMKRAKARRGGFKHKKIRPRAFWEEDFREKVGNEKLTYFYFFRKFAIREFHLYRKILPAIVGVMTFIVALFFLFFFTFTDSNTFVIWCALTLELLIFPVFEAMSVNAMFWHADFLVGFFPQIAGYFFIGVIWFPTSLYYRSEIGDDNDADLWGKLLGMYVVAKLAYVLAVGLGVSCMVRRTKSRTFKRLPESSRKFIIAHRDRIDLKKYLIVFPPLVFGIMALYFAWVFYAYSFISLREDTLLQFIVTGVAIPLVDTVFRVWLSGFLSKTITKIFLGLVNENEAFVFAIRFVKIGFAIVQAFGTASIANFEAFIASLVSQVAIEIGMVMLSMFRRHHPKAPHVRQRIANFFGLPGKRMFPQKTRIESASLYVNQDLAEKLCVVFGVLFSQLPLALDSISDSFPTKAYGWFEAVMRTLIMIFIFEIPGDMLKAFLSTRRFGIDTFHLKVEFNIYHLGYMSTMVSTAFLCILGAHALFVLWEGDELD